MRILKFRAWGSFYRMSKTEKPRMDYDIVKYTDFGGGKFSDFLCNDNLMVMEFPGLIDKFGKEIWEGDIVQCLYPNWCSTPQIVQYRSEYGGACLGVGGFMPFIQVSVEAMNGQPFPKDYEVLGNIYENPDLLK